ncbi:MAG: 23S rRNA (adenine(2503)-C(2))-methyltransferase RlmN [Dehalococcoidales bacterium]|nr:23S rRNA (adenine(2503)-C(2))-methyltransferase RlmN [Dehalococcoidales bacterium]
MQFSQNIIKTGITMSGTITDFTKQQIEDLVVSLGEPAYRSRQILNRVYQRLAWTFEEMADLPRGLREKLSDKLPVHGLEEQHLQTGADGTVKGLFRLADGKTVEAALMLYRKSGGGGRCTVCVSTQVGCGIGCPFCATGKQGFERDLTGGEMVDQVLYFARYLRDLSRESAEHENLPNITNIVFMGMGEPLANYDELWKAIENLNSPEAFGLGARNITISTAGLVPQIIRLGREKLQVGLAVSLHAGTNELRDKLVPLNRKYPLEELMAACREYYTGSGRRVSFEYVLFRGVNDSLQEARSLAALLRGLNCHVNLIPANETGNRNYQPPPGPAVTAFQDELRRLNIKTTVRQSRGRDIDAGCGQLRSRLKDR